MEISYFLAKIIGPVWAVLGVAILSDPDRYEKVIKEFIKSKALMHISGFLALVLGLVMSLLHNIWIASWEIIITVMAWSALIKGTMLNLFPEESIEFIKRMNNKSTLQIAGASAVVLGLFLMYMGYIA